MKKFRHIFVLLVGFLIAFVQAIPAQNDVNTEIKKIKDRFFAEYISESRTSASTFLASQEKAGNWKDINYNETSGSATAPQIDHLKRVLIMAAAYQKADDKNFHSSLMLSGIETGLQFWYDNGYKSSNWFDTVIGQQLLLQKILILMDGYIPESLIQKGCIILTPVVPTFAKTGQNLIWVTSEQLHRGILQKNEKDIQEAIDIIQGTLTIVSFTGKSAVPDARKHLDEGIQEDYSFHQHGSQIYNGGYGRSFLLDHATLADMVRETRFAYKREKLDILSDFLLKGTGMMIRNANFFDPSVCNRYIGRKGGTKATSIIPALEKFERILPENKASYQAIRKNIEGTGNPYSFLGNKYFANSEYMVHQREGFFASTRMTSGRTRGAETINNENVKGYWTTFGASFITRHGNEYFDIFPVWNWSHIPGVTSPDTVPMFVGGNNGQDEKFVGGVSNGKYGFICMNFNKFNTRAKKTMFYFENEVVALGAGISSTVPNEVHTTLNQCFLKEDLLVDGKAIEPESEYQFDDAKWIYHDKVGYMFPKAQKVIVRNLTQSGSWSSIGVGTTKKEQAKVFTLALNHGKMPENGSYEYLIIPDVKKNDVAKLYAKLPVQIIENSEKTQSVRHNSLKITQIAFYNSGKLDTDSYEVEINKPGLVMIQELSGNLSITASNPECTDSTLELIFRHKSSGKKVSVSFDFIQGSKGGFSQTKSIDW